MTTEPVKPVAEIGPVYTLLWAGCDPVASIVNAHNLKVGDKLVSLADHEAAMEERDATIREQCSQLSAMEMCAADLQATIATIKTRLSALAGEMRKDGPDDTHSNSMWDQGYIYGRSECADLIERTLASTATDGDGS